MARYKFGGTAQDGVYSKFAFAGKSLLALAGGTVTAWTAKTGGTQHTDLLDAAGNPVTSIKVTDGQLPEFSGPDGVTELWVDDGGDTERHLLVNRQTGPQGPPGPGGSDADVAGYVNTAGTQTRTAVDNRAQATLDTHLNVATDAHDASAISYAGSANLAANNVEAALDELDAEKADVGHTHAVSSDPWHTIGGAGEPVFAVGWSNATASIPAGTPSAGFRKDSANNLHLRGCVAGTANTKVIDLPVGYRVSATRNFTTQHAGATQGIALLRLNADGSVFIYLVSGTAPTGGAGYYFDAVVSLT